MSWKKFKLKEVLNQYRVQHIVQDSIEYKQVSILNDGSVVLRGNKIGKEIGRKRQFKIDLNTYPDTLIFTRQLLLQGSIGIASEDVNDCIVTENMPMFSIQTLKIDKEFLILFLKSEVFKSRIRKIELSGSAQKSIHERTFLDLEFLIPDIDLQKIIVVELLKLKSNGNTISSELTHQRNLIKQLRQAFLREAMQGKLIESTNTKETGQQLLEKIKAEKAHLIAEKKLKKKIEFPPITEDEIPFEIPEHWTWCRLGEVCEFNPRNKANDDTDVGFCPMPLIYAEYNKDADFEIKKWKTIKSGFTHFADNDVVFGKITPCFQNSKAAIIKNLPNGIGAGTTELYVLRGFKGVSSGFLYNFIKTPDFLIEGERLMRGVAGQQRVPREFVENSLLALPPLHEQEQIVAKLEELMAFCDGLEQSIKESQGYNEKLLQQVLREALQG